MSTEEQSTARMSYRKLRIAWSVGWGLLAVVLCALWVRSYSIRDSAYWPTNKLEMEINSFKGRVVLFLAFRPNGEGQINFRHKKITHGILGFLYFREEDTAGIHVPFWFPTLTFAALAAAPWVKLSKRFSLRTLLIATTLIALLLWVVVWAMRN